MVKLWGLWGYRGVMAGRIEKNQNRICKHCSKTFYRRGSAIPVYCSMRCMAEAYSNPNNKRRSPSKTERPPALLRMERAVVAADLTGYSRYALARLAKANKITGMLYDRNWYYDVGSIRDYIKRMAQNGSVRSPKIIVPDFGRSKRDKEAA